MDTLYTCTYIYHVYVYIKLGVGLHFISDSIIKINHLHFCYTHVCKRFFSMFGLKFSYEVFQINYLHFLKNAKEQLSITPFDKKMFFFMLGYIVSLCFVNTKRVQKLNYIVNLVSTLFSHQFCHQFSRFKRISRPLYKQAFNN